MLSVALFHMDLPLTVDIAGEMVEAYPIRWEHQAHSLLWALLHPGKELVVEHLTINWYLALLILRGYYTYKTGTLHGEKGTKDPIAEKLSLTLHLRQGFEEAMVRSAQGDPDLLQCYCRAISSVLLNVIDLKLWYDLSLPFRFRHKIRALGGYKPIAGETVEEGGRWTKKECAWRKYSWELVLIEEEIMDSSLLAPFPSTDIESNTWKLHAAKREEDAKLYYEQL